MPSLTLRTLAERVLAAEQRLFRRMSDCSDAQMRLLLRIAGANTIAMRELVQQTGWEKSAVTRATDVLHARGLVTKEPDAADARALLLAATQSGHQLARQVTALLDTEARALIGGLAPADRAAADRILSRLCHLLDTDARVAGPELE
ncbi:MarR family transcriptional regulator [Niveibacterium sp.]|uniref:MarR family transcriptional regulator n=1 Tax=Niveibacterium sp. TaxID=2017444 RepID=UPI0035B49493